MCIKMAVSNCVINELLSYSCFYINNSTIDNIKKIVNLFYCEDEIIQAKKVLFDISGEDLGSFLERKSTNKRSSSLAHVNDIFDSLIKLDGLNKLPIFVAKDITRLPDRKPEELNLLYIIERLSNLEKKVKYHEESLTSQATEILSLKEDKILKPTIEVTNVIGDNIVNKESQEVEENSIDNKNVSYMSKDDCDRENNPNNLTYAEAATSVTSVTTPGTVKKIVKELNSVWNSNNPIEGINIVSKDREIVVDEDDFVLYESKSKRKNRLNNDYCSLEGAPPPPRHLFVSRITKGNSSSIAKYLKDKSIDVYRVELKSHTDSKFKSFKITLSKNDVNNVLNESFWPHGIRCNKWNEPKSISGDNFSNVSKNNKILNEFNIHRYSDRNNGTKKLVSYRKNSKSSLEFRSNKF